MKYDLDTIISTKITCPPVRSGIILRKRLTDILFQSLTQKLTLISAPAGFGKTTLTSAWVNQLDLPVAWYSLDTLDNYPARFLQYLLAGLKKTESQTPNIDPSLRLIAECSTLESMFGYVFNALSIHTPFTIIVLDDYHVISNPEIHEIVSFILQNQPPITMEALDSGKGCHWVIVTRQDPPFPLARWRLRQELTEIRSHDLRFSREEVQIVLNEILNVDLSAEEIADLEVRTEGWIAGIQMAALSMKGKNSKNYKHFIQQFKGKNKFVSDYLIEEVIGQQTEEIRSFLISASILERMNGDLCTAVTGNQNSHQILETLERNNVFVNPMDDERGWYRFHQLFLDVLRNQFKLQPEEIQALLHERAARWFEEKGFLDECLYHWLAIERFDQAAQYIASVSPELLSHGQFMRVRDLVEAVPQHVYQDWPWLPIYRAWVCFMLEPDAAEFWLELAEKTIREGRSAHILDNAEINEMLGNIATLYSLCAVQRGELNTTFHYAPIAMDLLPEHVDKVRGLVLSSIAFAQLLSGHVMESLQMAQQSKVVLAKGGNLGGLAGMLYWVGEIKIIQGRLCEAAEIFQEAIALSDKQDSPSSSFNCCSYSGLGMVLFEWNQLEDAFRNLVQGHELSKGMGYSERIYCTTALANAYISLGDLDKAEQYLSEYTISPANCKINSWYESRLISSQISLLAARKDLNALRQLVSEYDIENIPVDEINREMVYLAYAHACYELGNLKSVLQMVNQLEPLLEKDKRSGRLIQVLALKSATLKKLANSQDALMEMMKCLKYSCHEGYVRTFLDLGESMLEVMSILSLQETSVENEPYLTYLKKVITAFLESNAKETQQTREVKQYKRGMLDPLTEQELRVLGLMVSGLNNKEIAQTLGVTVNTIKTHSSHIYEKLAVHNRVKAVTRARQLGILKR